MTSIFDRWTDLDPALALRRIEAAHGSAIFDKFAYLDPQHAIHQIEDALGIELDDVAGASSSATLEAAIEAAIDAAVSDSTPDWVPANAKIYIDLLNDRAWTEADGEVAINTLLGTDANVSNGWRTTVDYDSNALVENGYPAADGALALIGVARSMVLGGATARFKYRTELAAGHFSVLSADGGDYVTVNALVGGTLNSSSANGPLDNSILGVINQHTNVFALTITDNRLDLAANGSLASAGVLTAEDRPPGNPFVGALFDPSATGFYQEITIYDALPSTAGLSELTRIIPEDAKIHINLVQDWAWTEVDGFVAIDTLLGTDANTENGWGATSYDAGNLTVDGLVAVQAVAFIGSARTKLLAEATICTRFKEFQSAPNAVMTPLFVTAANGSDAVGTELVSSSKRFHSYSYGGSLNEEILDIVNESVGAINIAAMTITATRLDVAANGSDAVTAILADGDRPGANPFVAALIQTDGTALQSITIYDPLPSTAGLSALSETGVTNTAPIAIDFIWFGAYAPEGTVTIADAMNGNFVVNFITGTDPEGNPCAITLVAGSDHFEVGLGGGRVPHVTIANGDLSAGTYNFTLRATDPGGLYVEQEFTITVTA